MPDWMASLPKAIRLLNSKSAVAWITRRTTCHSCVRVSVRAHFGVDDREALVLDAAAERGHLSHVVHGISGAVFGARRVSQDTAVEVHQDRVHRKRRDQGSVTFEMRDDARANRVSEAVESRSRGELEDVTSRIGSADLCDDFSCCVQVDRDAREQLHVHFRAGGVGHRLAVRHLRQLADHAHDQRARRAAASAVLERRRPRSRRPE